MPYEDEIPPFVEPDHEMNELTGRVIGAAIEVAKMLGPGLDEKIYGNALCFELMTRQIPFARQVRVDVQYKGHSIGSKCIDLIVDDRLIVELKSVEAISSLHKAQLLTYLKLTHRKVGLLINFNCCPLKDGIKRVVNNTVA